MINAIDFYKADHRSQYPVGTQFVYGNWTPRSTKYAPVDYIVVAGQQGAIKKNFIEKFQRQFFSLPKNIAVARYKRRMDTSLGPGKVTVEHIAALHDLGYLPIRVKALPEGTIVKPKTPVLTIINTLPEFFWIVNYLETLMSAEFWPTMTSATIAYAFRKLMQDAAIRTGGDVSFVPLQGHDFSFRGLMGVEAAQLVGAGHLFSFLGTDTVPAIDYLEDYYSADAELAPVGLSVPATEHSVMCMGTKVNEIETFRRLLKLYPDGIVSIVSDTWDYWKVLTEYAVELKEEILARKPVVDADGNVLVPGRTVFRPDSGDPVKILTGYMPDEYTYIPEIDQYVCNETQKPLTEAEIKGSVQVLYDVFGGTENDKGFKVLNDSVGLIYGDSITLERADQILRRLEAKGFVSTSVVFGIGSFTYQYNTRDTFGFAMKATWGVVNGEEREIFKDPATDDGTKKSNKGLMYVCPETLEVEDGVTPDREAQGALEVIFENGKMVKEYSLEQVRSKLWG